MRVSRPYDASPPRGYSERTRSRSPPARGSSSYRPSSSRRSSSRSPPGPPPSSYRSREPPRRRPDDWIERSRDERGSRMREYGNDRPSYQRREYAYERPRPAPYHLDDARDSRRDNWERRGDYSRSREDFRGYRYDDRDRREPRRDVQPLRLELPAKREPPPRPHLSVPVKVRKGPRPGTLARRARDKPAPLSERQFHGCSNIDAYDLTVKLGQGTFGEVKQGIQRSTGRSVALKKVTIYEVKDGLPITALREIKLLKMLHHPYIVPVIDMAYRASTERGKMGDVYMVEPYMDHDLNGLLDNPSVQLPMNQIKLYMRELLEGMLYLHKNHIMHRDMKAANLLIDNHGQLQIADFGLARPFHDRDEAWRNRGWKSTHNYTEMVVTRWYRPPELLAGQRSYGPAIDMWGVGCILAEMITRKPIFRGTSEINQLELIAALCGSPNDDNFPGWSSLPGVKNATPSGRPDSNPNVRGRHDFGRYPRIVRHHFTTVVDCGRECADLIDKLLVLDPAKRMTAAEALEHEWFWSKPYPADPASLPKYLPSKEIDRNRRDRKAPAVVQPGHPGMPPHPGMPQQMMRPLRPPVVMPPGMVMPPGVPPGAAPAAGAPAPKGAYPPMPRLPSASGVGGQGHGRSKDYGWYNPSAPRGPGTRPY